MFTLFLLRWERGPWLTVNSNNWEKDAACSKVKASVWKMLWTVRDHNVPAPYYSKLILINIVYLHCISFYPQTLLSSGSRCSNRLCFVSTKWENIIRWTWFVREESCWSINARVCMSTERVAWPRNTISFLSLDLKKISLELRKQHVFSHNIWWISNFVIQAERLFSPFLFALTCNVLKANGLRSWKLQVKNICACLMWPQDTSADITNIPLKLGALNEAKNFHFHLGRRIMIHVTIYEA